MTKIKLPSNHTFGFFFTVFFVVLGTYFFSNEKSTVSYILFLIAAIFFGITLIHADSLLPLNKLWMRFGLLLGMIVSPIVLGLIFFGLFTPISLLMKLFRRDELRLKLTAQHSHWKERSPETFVTDRFKHQF